MRLTELEPRWFTLANIVEGTELRFGLTFLCPHCREQRIGVSFDPPIDPQGWLRRRMLWPKEHTQHLWRRTGDTFDTLTLSPSIDASGSTMKFLDHWHGHITNGEIVGGI